MEQDGSLSIALYTWNIGSEYSETLSTAGAVRCWDRKPCNTPEEFVLWEDEHMDGFVLPPGGNCSWGVQGAVGTEKMEHPTIHLGVNKEQKELDPENEEKVARYSSQSACYKQQKTILTSKREMF